MKVLVNIPEKIVRENGHSKEELALAFASVKNVKVVQDEHDLISRNNAITSIYQHYTALERAGKLYFTANTIKQDIVDLLCGEPAFWEGSEE